MTSSNPPWPEAQTSGTPFSGWRKLPLPGDDAHAARALGHQHPAVGQEGQRPRVHQSAGDGLHLELTGRRRERAVFAARSRDDQE